MLSPPSSSFQAGIGPDVYIYYGVGLLQCTLRAKYAMYRGCLGTIDLCLDLRARVLLEGFQV